MAGEMRRPEEWSGDNVANANFANPNVCVDLDVGNSSAIVTAVKLPTGALSECIGVCHDKSKLNPDGTVAKNSGIAIRSWGTIRITTMGAVTAGDYVSIGNASGQIQTQAQAGAGVQPKAIVGRALTSAASGEKALVMLMIGARY